MRYAQIEPIKDTHRRSLTHKSWLSQSKERANERGGGGWSGVLGDRDIYEVKIKEATMDRFQSQLREASTDDQE